MMRILHLIWRVDGGGIEQFCINVLKNSNSAEYTYDFVVCGEKYAGEDNDVLANSKIYHLPVINGKKGKKQYLNSLRKVLKDTKYDVVHSHLGFMNISTLKVAKKCGVLNRISHTHIAGFGNKNSIINVVKRYLMNYYATKCLACSKDTGDFYYGLNSKKLSILYSGIDIERFLNSSKKNANKIIVVARICPEKNPEFIINIAKKLKEKKQELEFYWCGDGADLLKLKVDAQQGRNPFLFVGGVSNVEEYLRDASYMLMPSLKEGFGMAAIEAQAAGVFVFASDRVPRDTDAGLIEYYPLDSMEAWVDRILETIEINKNHQRVITTERLKEYDIKWIVKTLVDIYTNKKHE